MMQAYRIATAGNCRLKSTVACTPTNTEAATPVAG